MKRILITSVIAAVVALSGISSCKTTANKNVDFKNASTEARAPVYHFEIINSYPHDSSAFTQGLVFRQGKLFESTGQEGRSSLREVELETGRVLRKVSVPSPYFAEGITLLSDKIYQLTWQHQLGFVYDVHTFEKIGEFRYSGEGWGLTDDGQSLILSDGTNRIRFCDPASFRLLKTILVVDAQSPVTDINELEYIRGEIYANIWHEDRIARINPLDGRVIAWIDLTALSSQVEVHDDEAVLNGIAYDDESGRLFVTGKLWPKLFEIRIK